MAMNPYEILGIDRTANDDEIKRAYRELAKKYHPDNFKDNPLSDLANEKMKQINEAYDIIQKERNNRKNDDYSAYNGYSHSGNGGTYGNSQSDSYRVRELINESRYSEAEIILNRVHVNERDAEWYYLKGVILTKRGWFFDAQKNFQTACNMDPSNAEYRDALYSTRHTSNRFNSRRYNAEGNQNAGCSGCDICTGLICADCLCECLGGDCIKCC